MLLKAIFTSVSTAALLEQEGKPSLMDESIRIHATNTRFTNLFGLPNDKTAVCVKDVN